MKKYCGEFFLRGNIGTFGLLPNKTYYFEARSDTQAIIMMRKLNVIEPDSLFWVLKRKRFFWWKKILMEIPEVAQIERVSKKPL